MTDTPVLDAISPPRRADAMPVILRPSMFRLETRHFYAVHGQSIADILRAFPDLPPEVWSHGVVRIGEWEIPRDRWERVRPRPGSVHEIFIGVRLAGGGSKGGKNPFATIAAIALLVVATAITGGAAAGIFGTSLFAAGSTSAALLAAGVGVIGALAINALAPPPSAAGQDTSSTDAKTATLGGASIQGNVLRAFEPIPFVIGTHRVSPPHIVPPWSESINDDQFINAIVALNGAHRLADILVNGAPIDTIADIEYETRDVVTGDGAVTLIGKQVFESQIGSELTAHKVQDDSPARLLDAATPANSYPRWASGRTKADPDEVWLTFAWSSLVSQESTGIASGGVALRIRIRKVGDTAWINLPEFHAQRTKLGQFRGTIKLRFSPPSLDIVRMDQDTSRAPWRWALQATDAANGEGFDTDAYFAPISGNNSNFVTSEDGVAVLYLDPASFPKGVYDIQAMRGYAYQAVNLTPSTYKLSGSTPYFFTHTPASDPPSIAQDQSKIASQCSWSGISSVWNEPPLTQTGFSLIAIRAKNISISSLTVLATGYANTWNGVDWNTFAPTANPADWWRYIALGGQSVKARFTAAQLDDDALTQWRDYCAARSFTCNAYIDGRQSMGEILNRIAGCGRAARRMSDKFGVVVDRDRTADPATQTFTQRNTRGLTVRRAFPRLPDGFAVTFNDETNDYAPKEVLVYRRTVASVAAPEIEAVTYSGITSEAQAISRAQFDLGQLTRRGRLYNFDIDIEMLATAKGDIVNLMHDTLARHHDAARVVGVIMSGGMVTGLELDSVLRLSLSNGLAAGDVGVVVQQLDGESPVLAINEIDDSGVVTFVDPFPMPAFGGQPALDVDCLVACGPFLRLRKRMLVLGVEPQSEYAAAVTLVDEAAPLAIVTPFGGRIFAFGGIDRIRPPY